MEALGRVLVGLVAIIGENCRPVETLSAKEPIAIGECL